VTPELATDLPTVLPSVRVTRYVTPLREGGSLPGVVEGDDLGTYVCKFRGAGQGAKVLVAEVIVSGLATRLGLRTPRLVVLDLDPELARYEADEEVQDLLNASVGANLGIDFLPGSFGVDGQVATDPARFAAQPWDARGHVFESCARRARELDDEIAAPLDSAAFAEVLATVPDVWLEAVPGADGADELGPDALRASYVDFLTARLGTRQWLPGVTP
jgi:hypothetical protein